LEAPGRSPGRADPGRGRRVTGPRVVLDAGVLDLVDADQELRWTLWDLVDGGWEPVIPTVVLAEAVTGQSRDTTVNRLVKRLGTEDSDEPLARRAGQLRSAVQRSGARRIPSGIDALVAAHAAVGGSGVVFTT